MTDVTVETVDGVSIITLNAPERRNALTVEMCGDRRHRAQSGCQRPAGRHGGSRLLLRGRPGCAAPRDAGPGGRHGLKNLGRIYELFQAIIGPGSLPSRLSRDRS